ncbi:SDR family NAD(P)-dependent oxidoreductase [Mumia sp. Pv 4-285]|uniref:SDR family NAD(P)-dependent oxidoreductase n=1 Tax=Mumia qirimensis TaxID=3234852 RepID=UPI00351D8775
MTARRVALVTGAARGQGLAVVRTLLDDGYAVVACDVLADELVSTVEPLPRDAVLAQRLDVTSADEWQEAIAAVRERFGRLDGLVSNAGILHRSPLLEEDPADFERAWRVNTLGLLLALQTCVPLLREGTAPAVVVTASNAAMRPFAEHAGYGASKWGARGLAQSAAVELAELGIRVNTLLPGAIATPMLPEASIPRISSWVPLGRPGRTDEIASVVSFLLSEQASYLTGAEILVDGGQLLRTHL